MKYEEIVFTVTRGSIITFSEYSLDRHEHKQLKLSINPVPVETVIPPNTSLGRLELEKYYGTELSELDYCQLSCINAVRIIVIIGSTEEGQPIYKPLLINQDFFNMGLQVLDVLNQSQPTYRSVYHDTYYTSR